MSLNKDDYENSVDGLAQEAVEKHGPSEESVHEYVAQYVQWSRWCIEVERCRLVRQYSAHWPSDGELSGMVAANAGIDARCRMGAYMAMERDVMARCRELIKDMDD